MSSLRRARDRQEEWGMKETRCQWDLEGENPSGLRCISCGEIIDEIILNNRQANPVGRVGKNRIAMRFGVHQHLNHHLCLCGLTLNVF